LQRAAERETGEIDGSDMMRFQIDQIVVSCCIMRHDFVASFKRFPQWYLLAANHQAGSASGRGWTNVGSRTVMWIWRDLGSFREPKLVPDFMI
jgi:hypothetical protein